MSFDAHGAVEGKSTSQPTVQNSSDAGKQAAKAAAKAAATPAPAPKAEKPPLTVESHIKAVQEKNAAKAKAAAAAAAPKVVKAPAPAPSAEPAAALEPKSGTVANPLPATEPGSVASPVGAYEPPGDGGEAALGGITGEPAPVQFAPNFKVKVMDQEYEIPENFRGLMKDADSEKQVREIFEKAHGLDVVKPRLQAIREKHQQLEMQHAGLVGDISELKEFYRAGDFESFFQKLNIPEEKILNWLVEKAKYSELPADQRQVYERQRQAELEARQLRKELTETQQTSQQIASQVKRQLLQVALARPDVSEFATAFDSRPGGKPGDFVNEVINRGELAWYTRQEDLLPDQAVQQVMSMYAGFTPKAAQAPAAPAAPAPQAQAAAPAPAPAAQKPKPPVIPNVAGRSNAGGAKSKPRSIEDLKNLQKAMAARG